MRSFTLALLTWGMAVCAQAQASEAADWLSRMTQAEQKQSFNGTFVYERNGVFSTHQVWQRVDSAGAVHERLLQLDGPAHEAFSVDGQIRCLGGGLADRLATGTQWLGRVSDPSEVAQYFDLRLIGDARVAGREAVVVAVIPRDQHRYGFELHLDKQTALPLKSLLLDEKGQQLERLQFTHLDASASLEPATLQPGEACDTMSAEQAEPSTVGGWASEWLPPGFSLEGYSEKGRPDSTAPLVMLTYAGPLARFSVFLEPLEGARIDDARSQLGPTVVVSKRIPTETGDMMVTVIGEIPLGTAERVALSMRYQPVAEP